MSRRVLAAWIVVISASLALIGIVLCGICYMLDRPAALSQLFDRMLGLSR